MARLDAVRLTFGEVNRVGYIHRLPAAVLASVCGYTSRTATFPLSAEELRDAITLLAPAEAALHWEHPNLWTGASCSRAATTRARTSRSS